MSSTQSESQSMNHPADTKEATPKKAKNEFLEVLRFAFVALLIIVPFRALVAQPFMVNGDSMVPTFQDKNYLIVDQLSYRLGEIGRGDVVVFKAITDPRKFFIKRVIGLPGETIEVSENQVFITASGESEPVLYNEPYLTENTPGNTRVVLDSDEYFVMGDNRDNSSDSRFWGALPRDHIVGRPFVRLFPFNMINHLPGDYKPNDYQSNQ